jgi:hypothetical protein
MQQLVNLQPNSKAFFVLNKSKPLEMFAMKRVIKTLVRFVNQYDSLCSNGML